MEKQVKIFLKEHLDAKTKQTYKFYKGLFVNDTKDRIFVADLKWYIKAEKVAEMFSNSESKCFLINISKVEIKEVQLDDKKVENLVFYVDKMDDLENNEEFLTTIKDISEEKTVNKLNVIFE